jgi:hypothetical protein
MKLYPACQPKINLVYELWADDNEILDTWSKVERTIPHDECSLMFDIEDLEGPKTIIYDMLYDEVVNSDSYVMQEFRLLKLEDEGMVFAGILFHTRIEGGSFNIKLAGRIRSKVSDSIPYLTVPR